MTQPWSETMRRKFSADRNDGFDTLRPGSRVRDCEGDAWFKAADGDWICETDPVSYPDAELLNCYGPVVRIRAMKARQP